MMPMTKISEFSDALRDNVLRQLAARDIGGFCLPERFTGGAAVGDVNNDGWTDVVVTPMIDPKPPSSTTKARNLYLQAQRTYFHRHCLRELMAWPSSMLTMMAAWICFTTVGGHASYFNNRIRMRVARI